MDTIQFYIPNCLILEVRSGTTAPEKGSRAYAVLSFLSQDTMQVFECFCFDHSASIAMTITPKSVLDLIFTVSPVRGRAGFRVDLNGIAQAGTAGLVMSASPTYE